MLEVGLVWADFTRDSEVTLSFKTGSSRLGKSLS